MTSRSPSDPGQTHFVGDDCLPDGHRDEPVTAQPAHMERVVYFESSGAIATAFDLRDPEQVKALGEWFAEQVKRNTEGHFRWTTIWVQK